MTYEGGDVTSTLTRRFCCLSLLAVSVPLTRLAAFHRNTKGGGRRLSNLGAGLTLAVLMLVWVGTASAQCGVFKTWAFREVLQSSDINSAFQRTVNANTPTCTQAYSSSVSQMQSASDPYPSSSESLASTLSGELERLRFQIKAVVGKGQWYYTADNALAKDVPKHWGATFTKYREITDPVAPGPNEAALYFKDDGGGNTVLAYQDSNGVVNTLAGPSTSYGNTVTVNLLITNNPSAPNTVLDYVAQRISVGGFIKANWTGTIDLSTTGANALDAGTIAANTVYGVYLIYNKTTNTFAGLASTSETSPTMPSGYTVKRLLATWLTNSSGQLMPGVMRDRTFSYLTPVHPCDCAVAGPTQIVLAGYAPAQITTALYGYVHAKNNVGIGNRTFKLHWLSFAGGVGTFSTPVFVTTTVDGVVPFRVPTHNSNRTTIFYEAIFDVMSLYITGYEVAWNEL